MLSRLNRPNWRNFNVSSRANFPTKCNGFETGSCCPRHTIRERKRVVSLFDRSFRSVHSADTNTVEYLISQPSEMNDEGTYLCNASSASGSDIGEIYVDVLGKLEKYDKES